MKKLTALFVSASLTLSSISSAVACTSLIVPTTEGSYVYGRTMEFGIPLKSEVMVSPRNFDFKGVGIDGKAGSGLNWKSKYAVAGMNALGQPIVVDGINEKGMTGGLMNAPNTAVYQKPTQAESANSIASYQMLIYALSNYATVDEVKKGFSQLMVNSSTLGAYKGVVQVRMQLHDSTGKSIVVEYLKGQLVVTDNPTGVMTNDPAFAEQLNNIGNYANLSKVERDPVVINGVKFAPPSSGSGLHGLPGDYLSPSRFIRALFLSSSVPTNVPTAQQVNSAWHVLGSFDIPPGAVTLPASNPYGGGSGGYETTEWTVVADNKNLVYYVKPYENTVVQAYDLKKADLNSKTIQTVKMKMDQTYLQLN